MRQTPQLPHPVPQKRQSAPGSRHSAPREKSAPPPPSAPSARHYITPAASAARRHRPGTRSRVPLDQQRADRPPAANMPSPGPPSPSAIILLPPAGSRRIHHSPACAAASRCCRAPARFSDQAAALQADSSGADCLCLHALLAAALRAEVRCSKSDNPEGPHA
ncbi:hypothetical protein D3C73_870500 [compost metagenome]